MYNGLNVQLHYAGYISMLITGGRVIASILVDRVIRRLGTGVVIVISVTMTAAALIGFSLSPAFIFLCLCSVPLGLGAGFVDASLNNYVALYYKAKYMSWLHCFWGIGASVGPIIVSFFLINRDSWSLGYRTIGIIQGCYVVVLFLTLSLWGKNQTTQDKIKVESSPPIPFKDLFLTPGLILAVLSFFCYCTIQATAGLWGSSYLVMEKNIPAEVAAQFVFLFFIGITSGRLIAGFLTMKIANRQIIRLGLGVIALGIIALFLPHSRIILFTGYFLIGCGCGPIFPGLLYETPRNFGVEKSQAIMGVQMACAFIGVAFMPPLFGRIASYTGFIIFPFFLGAVLIINFILIESLFRKVDRNKT